MSISDHEFIERFENHTLPPEYFDHLGHIRIAWLYLNLHDRPTALNKVCHGIKTYAGSLGATEKFHYTITQALALIIAERMTKLASSSWREFLEQNGDLTKDALGVLEQYYSGNVLHSPAAKAAFVEPDKLRVS